MSLKSIFSEHISSLLQFMDAPGQIMRVVRYEPDVEPLLEKILVKLDDDPQNHHVLVVCKSPCHSAQQYAGDLSAELVEQNERFRGMLSDAGIELPRLGHASNGESAAVAFERYVSAVADCLPSWCGSFVVVIYPSEIANEPDFKTCMEFLAQNTRSPLARYIVLDRQTDPILHDIVECTARASVQVFEFSPEVIEQRVKADLTSGALTPRERRQYSAMVGSFALAKRDYFEAEKVQQQTLKMAQDDGAPAEEAAARYNLGNVYLAQGKLELAEEQYARSIEVAVQEELHALAAMGLTNLGITLQQLGDIDRALESFDVAQRTFKAIPNPPGVAHVLDNKAQVLHREGRNDEAEQTWQEALATYEGITAETFSKLRDTGCQDIRAKLRQFYEATNQHGKLQLL